MTASPSFFTTDTIVHKVLDSICPGCYAHTPFTNHSGYIKEDMLYYNTRKIGWLSTTTIYSGDSAISDINLHRLYYKSPTLAATHDTIFLSVILVHLESGSGSANQRATEISGAMSWLHNHITVPGNYIFMGDFNTQSSNESCYQQIVNSANPNTLFFDPVNQAGDWNNNPNSFAGYLTQSTRTSDPGDCGATGGLDDRFDHILCTSYLMNGLDSLQYISGSYRIIGQDGQHVNKSIIANPSNSSVPQSVLSALYYMSEHLPVELRLSVGGGRTTGLLTTSDQSASGWIYDKQVTDRLHISYEGHEQEAQIYTLRIYSMDGQMLRQLTIDTKDSYAIPLETLPEGMFLLQISGDDMPMLNGKFVKLSR
jgi:hypothetical protein